MKLKSRIFSSMAMVSGVVGVALYAAPIASAVPTLTDNGNGSVTVSSIGGSERVWFCATSVAASSCDGTNALYWSTTIGANGTWTAGTTVKINVLPSIPYDVPLPDGIFNISVGGSTGVRTATLSNATIGTGGGGGGSSSSSSAAAPTETLSLAVSASGATCTGGNPSGVSGSWLALPSASQCSQSGPTAKAGAVLLGWSTNASFPIARAQAQVDKKWGVVDETIDGTRMIFIPAGMATFVSGSNNLYPIWSK